MPNPYPTALRERAVRAYEGSAETYAEVAARFSIHINTLVRWVQGARERGTVLPAPRGGGWYSPVDISLLHALIKERPDRTTRSDARVPKRPHRKPRPAIECVSRFSELIRLQKNARGVRARHSGIPAQRRAFRDRIGGVDVRRLVFLDESGANLAMWRSTRGFRDLAGQPARLTEVPPDSGRRELSIDG